jgi:hypothetical protein
MEDPRRRRLLWHAFLILFIALLLGLPTTFAPNGRAWMAAHVSGLIGSLMVVAVAVVWSELVLGEAQRRRAFVGILLGTWANLLLNIFGAVVNLPGPATQPGVKAPAWQMGVFVAFSLVLVPAVLLAAWTVLQGLRGRGPAAGPSSEA